MFLTEDEFKILCGLKMGLNSKKIKEKFGIQIYTNDPRIGSLCKKYGVKDKWELIDVANMKKVEVFSQDEIPYYTYEKADDISGFKYSDIKTLDKNFQYFKFRKNKKWGVVDRQATIIIEPKYSKLERADKNFNYMFVKVNDKEYLIDRHENIIDAETEDKLICTPDFIENIEHSINSNWRIVEINGKYGFYSKLKCASGI